MVRVVVDSRERGCAVPGLLAADPRFEVRTERLRAGDYLVEDRVLVERKSMGDFVASVIDTRVFRQASALSHSPFRAVLILEGSGSGVRPRIGRRQIQGAIVSLTLAFNVPVLRSADARETVWLLGAIGRQAARRTARGMAARRWNPRDARAAQIHMLAAVPGLGPVKADRLLLHLGSLSAVVNATEAELAGIRGIGPATARRIRRFLDAPTTDEPGPRAPQARNPSY